MGHVSFWRTADIPPKSPPTRLTQLGHQRPIFAATTLGRMGPSNVPLAVNVARRKETRLIIEWSSIIVTAGSAPSCFRRVTGRAAICLSVNFSYNTACRELSDYSGISTVNRKGQIFVRPMK
jgi:hypothetical protein